MNRVALVSVLVVHVHVVARNEESAWGTRDQRPVEEVAVMTTAAAAVVLRLLVW